MIFNFLRKTYAKVMRMWNEYEKEMGEWAQEDADVYAYCIYYCTFTQEMT